jgi:sirohydrochlorin cobaltochelatase
MPDALVVAAHGSHLNPGSSTPAFDHADRVRATGAFDEVREAFWKEEPAFREVLRVLDGETVYVVPLFISEGYFTEQVIPRELRLEGWSPDAWASDGVQATAATFHPTDVDKTVHYCGPVGTHDAMSRVIAHRADAILDEHGTGPRPERVGLAVVGHGTERNENSAKAVRYHADRLRAGGDFDEVRALFMDEAPEVDALTTHFETPDVVVVPLFIADGYHTQEDIPEDIGLTADYRTGYDVPVVVDGHRVWYTGAVGTDPLMAEVILERARDAGASVPTTLRIAPDEAPQPSP